MGCKAREASREAETKRSDTERRKESWSETPVEVYVTASLRRMSSLSLGIGFA